MDEEDDDNHDSATSPESHVSSDSVVTRLDWSPWMMRGCRSREISSKRFVRIASLGSANNVSCEYGIAPHSTPNSVEREEESLNPTRTRAGLGLVEGMGTMGLDLPPRSV